MKVLLVEDHDDVRFLMRFMLEREGCRVVGAADVREAVAYGAGSCRRAGRGRLERRATLCYECGMTAGQTEEYGLEACAWCSGDGKVQGGERCAVCRGAGSVMVAQPARRCPDCLCTGRDERGEVCRGCGGAGWLGVHRRVEPVPKPGLQAAEPKPGEGRQGRGPEPVSSHQQRFEELQDFIRRHK